MSFQSRPPDDVKMDIKKEEHVILTYLIRIMKQIGEYDGLKGSQKKELVIKFIDYELELPEELETLVISLIDILIDVEQGKIIFNANVKNIPSTRMHCCQR